MEPLDPRKAAILKRVVEEHIDTAQPVGSAHVVRDPDIDVSPATVRADMASLERDGYLTHPHTSAGRIPTEKGYRYFVDHIANPGALDPMSQQQVSAFFDRAHGELERMLRDTSQLLSDLTAHAAVVVAPPHEGLTVRSCLLTELGPGLALFIVVLSNGVVEKHALSYDEHVGEPQLEQAGRRLREHLDGQTLGRLSRPESSGDAVVDGLVDDAYRALAATSRPASHDDEIFVGGTARMAEQFGAVDTVRAVLSILEQSFVVVSLLRDVLAQGQGVAIGTETGVASLSECSLVVAPYRFGEQVAGTIGILGPTRMNYPQALAAVAVVGRHLSDRLAGS